MCYLTAFEHLFDLFQVLSLRLPSWCPAPSAVAVNPAKTLEKEKRDLPWGQRSLCQRARGEAESQVSRLKLVSGTLPGLELRESLHSSPLFSPH